MTGGLTPNGTHFASEWFKFVVEVAKTSLDSSAKQGTLASPTTKVSTGGLTPHRSPLPFQHFADRFFQYVAALDESRLFFGPQLDFDVTLHTAATDDGWN